MESTTKQLRGLLGLSLLMIVVPLLLGILAMINHHDAGPYAFLGFYALIGVLAHGAISSLNKRVSELEGNKVGAEPRLRVEEE